MLVLRHAFGWQFAGIVFLALALVVAMLPEIPFWHFDPNSPFALSDKALHMLTFTFLAAWFSGQYSRQSYWRIALGLVLFGALIEVFQGMVSYRTSEWMDLYADAVGIAACLIIALLGVGGWSQRVELWLER